MLFTLFNRHAGTPNIIVVLQGGIALPPYYFQAGGVREFLNCVEDYATLIKYDYWAVNRERC